MKGDEDGLFGKCKRGHNQGATGGSVRRLRGGSVQDHKTQSAEYVLPVSVRSTPQLHWFVNISSVSTCEAKYWTLHTSMKVASRMVVLEQIVKLI